MAGWADLFESDTSRGMVVTVGSATPAILTCMLLFILPQSYDFWPFAPWSHAMTNAPSLITWRLIETKMCWGVIFLLGGGFALADASQKSGLSTLLVAQLNTLELDTLPIWLVCFIIAMMTVTITNIASNTATANVLVPILAEMAVTLCINPIYLTLPAGIVCSYAFAWLVSINMSRRNDTIWMMCSYGPSSIGTNNRHCSRIQDGLPLLDSRCKKRRPILVRYLTSGQLGRSLYLGGK